MTEYNILGQPIGGNKRKKETNPFGGGLDVKLLNVGIDVNQSESQEIKRTSFKADFNYLMDKQKGKCAYQKCVTLHGVKQKVHTLRDLDHKIPVRLWELMKKKGNVNMRSNLQLLCPGCHRHKTAEDRKKIALYQQSHPADPNNDGLFGGGNLFEPPPKRSKNNPFGL